MDGEEAGLEDSFFADLRNVPQSYVAPGGDFLIGVIGDIFVACGGYVPRSTTEVEIKRMRCTLHTREWDTVGRCSLRSETTSAQGPALSLYTSSGYRQVGEARVRGFEVLQFRKALP